MNHTLYLLGDINLKGVDDATGLFDRIRQPLLAADLVFANLECCLYDLPEHAQERRGFYTSPRHAQALRDAGLQAVGNANNVNIGHEAVLSSLAALRAASLPSVGAGADSTAARAPLIEVRDGVRYGFLQRTAVYWPDNHEAGAHQAGVAIIKAHTAYRPRLETQAARTRPGVPPEVLTWACPESLAQFRADVAALRAQADVVVASLHWGYRREVLQYQREYAHAAIEAGADLVLGHGPHMILPVELHQGRPILYGSGNFSFQVAHQADAHTEWTGMIARVEVRDARPAALQFSFVQRNPANQTVLAPASAVAPERDLLVQSSAALGARLSADGDGLRLELDGRAQS
ncbi:CapA family protein [Achromobacter agilis]|uniref:Putative polyglutamine synthesis accessory protein n=1 Tax=Achromobacter agilis TaxID=1353888 RepID=A0A446CI40_9BURK|nr:CapA family protein [Achromobacter agilis]SSW67471.1 putative polyglutamine synthesis accessory protein [Achromobacter agilis]